MKPVKVHQDISMLYIETTERCNLHCKYCYNKSSKCVVDLKLNSILQVLDDLAAYEMYPHIILSGGEFLMRNDCKEILSCLVLKSSGITIATNGILLTDQMIAYISQLKNVLIQVSLDGLTDGDNIYRGLKADIIISVIEKLFEYGMKERFSIRMTIHKMNFNHVEQMMLFCYENNIELRLAFMCFSSDKPLTKKYLLDQDEIFKTLCSVKEFNNYYNFDFQLPDICVGGICGIMDEKGSLTPKIDVKGNVYACQAGQSENFLLGCLSESTIYNCTQPEKLRVLRSKIRLRNQLLQKICNNCTLTESCLGRCVAHIENEEGSLYQCSDRYRIALERYLECGNVN